MEYNQYNTPLGKYVRKKDSENSPIEVYRVDKEGAWFDYSDTRYNYSQTQFFDWDYFNLVFVSGRQTPVDLHMETDY